MDMVRSSKTKKRIGRNDPCPCGSGKKYEHCCLDTNLDKSPPSDINSEDFSKRIWKKHQEYLIKEKIRTQMFGKVRPVIHTDFKGYKMVAVGNQLHYSKSWKTFPDFLFTCIVQVLGSDWGNQELKKPYDERHQILKWYDGVCHFQGNQKKGENGIYSAIPDGVTAAYLRLAYDLYILRHHTALQKEVVRRLKNQDQFQGSRYELFVASTFIRAGFDIGYEDESDRTITHPEFVATHKVTGQIVSVEAKSRHRPGVLGFPGEVESESDIKLGVRRLLNRALLKTINHPYVIFIDLNLPPLPGRTFEKPWFGEILSSISKDGGPTKKNPDPYNLLVFTNHPDHYGKEGEIYPKKDTIFVVPKYSRVPVHYPKIIEEIHEAASQYGNIPNEFPGDWDS